jgi:hypothetical protein
MFRHIALLIMLLCAAPAFAQFANITDTGITDASGAVLASGRECFTPVNNQRVAIAAQYPGGTVTKVAKCSPVINGVMTPITLVKSNLTNPINLCYMRTIVDLSTGQFIVGPNDGYSCVQPSVDTNMNTVQPNTPGLGLAVVGPTGATGPQGPQGPQGVPGTGNAAVGAAGSVQIASPSGNVAASDNTTVINTLAIQEYVNTMHPPLAYWDAAFHNCNNQIVNVVVHGDSRSVADATYTSSLTVTFGNRWVDLLTKQLWGMCGVGGLEVPFQSNAGGSGIMNPDYYTFSGSYSLDNTLGPYQGANVPWAGEVKATSNGATFTFTPGISFDTLSCFGVSSTSLYPWTMNVDGATVGTCGGSTGSQAAGLYTGSAVSLGTHSVTLVCTTQPCEAYSLMVTAGSTGVRMHNFSVGSCAAECFGLAPSTQFAFSDLIPGGQALDIFNLIANEPGVGYSTGQFQTTLNNMITHDRAMAYPPSILMISPLQDGIGGQDGYYPIIRSTAQASSTAFFDMRDRWGASPVSFMEGPDTYHENNIGNGELYSAVAGTIIDIPSLQTTGISASSCPVGKVMVGISSAGSAVCSFPTTACGAGFSHGTTLTIATSQVTGSLADFPVELSFNGATGSSITLTNIAGIGSSGQVQNTNGSDVQFCDASGNYLSYEKVSYVASTGAALWYVRLPTAATGSVITMYWGNTSTIDSSNMAGTWKNYAAVYHINGSTSPSFSLDSTGNGQTLSFFGGTGIASPVGSGFSFPSGAYANASMGSTVPTGSAARSIEAWQQFPSGNSSEAVMFGFGANGNAFALEHVPSYSALGGVNVYDNWNSNGGFFAGPADTSWHLWSSTMPSGGNTGSIVTYKDGTAGPLCSSYGQTKCPDSVSTGVGALQINGVPTTNGAASGTENVSEFRVSTVERTAAWFASQYNNQSNPAAFFTLGTIH